MRAANTTAAIGLMLAVTAACAPQLTPSTSRESDTPHSGGSAQVATATPVRYEWRIPRHADARELRTRIAERAVFDAETIDVPDGEDSIVLHRPSEKFEQYDWIVLQLRALDEDIAERASLREVPDAELVRRFEAVFAATIHVIDAAVATRDRLLLEIVRRGGEGWRARLEAKLRAGNALGDLELLIALRRLEGMPDPVRLEGATTATSTYPDAPRVSVRLVNRDERPVSIRRGGNYRSGRLSRWNVEVLDAKGRLVPAIDWGAGEEGGISQRSPLASGESIETTLPLANYVEPLSPGEYRARIRYHDEWTIASPEEYPGHVTVDGDAFLLRVLPRVVETTAEEQERLARLAGSLPTAGEVALFNGPYGPWAHGVVTPESAAGQVLGAGWAAVPSLLRLAASNGAEPKRRAWALALLGVISDSFGPLSLDAVGTCASYEEDAGRATSSYGSSVERIDATQQTRIAERWSKIASGVEFRVKQ